ncbi:4Fe-4S dicluster domain-containing protein [Amorphus sp. 3PC139-8]|uniref:4Fe-4S dicluster domain-containing protein n=1 Tax=Amorphus sp. 3PC139-8 TaxID=2735676 RepID=UPI00345CC55E
MSADKHTLVDRLSRARQSGAKGPSRRTALKLMGATAAFSSLAGCVPPREEIVPYVDMPEGMVPGTPLFYASVSPTTGCGVLVESHDGRPTKIEGNPDHPMSLGATDAASQADVLDLYDPLRTEAVHRDGDLTSWGDFVASFRTRVRAHREQSGQGLAILTGAVRSLTLAGQLDSLSETMPEAAIYRHEPISDAATRAGAARSFGEPALPFPHLDRAEIVLFLDANLFAEPTTGVRHARDFAARRRARGGAGDFNRAYAVESETTTTGASCDHRLALPPSGIDRFAHALAARFGIGPEAGMDSDPADRFLDQVAADLDGHRGRGAVVAGRGLPAEIHDVVNRINVALGNAGTTISYLPPVDPGLDTLPGLAQLQDDAFAGRIDSLVILDCDPIYSAPDPERMRAALEAVDVTVHHGLYLDATAKACDWQIAARHFLEDWSDVQAADGTVAICQPLTRPLKGGRSVHELVALMAGDAVTAPHDLVRRTWQNRFEQEGADGGSFQERWRKVLHDGLVPGTGFTPIAPELAPAPPASSDASMPPKTDGLEIALSPDPFLWDGRRAANAWLQELPRPVTRLVWQNAMFLSPHDGAALDVSDGDMVRVKTNGATIELPATVQPGQAVGAASLHLGFGREIAGQVQNAQGVSAFSLRPDTDTWRLTGAKISKTGDHRPLLRTQHDFDTPDARTSEIVSLADYRALGPKEREEPPESLYPERLDDEGYAWAMVIDQSACIGCGACVAACQAENNVPVVGPEEIARNRDMHWLRVDVHQTPDETPETRFQPVPCMQCEKAPCEPVCPVEASVHDHEGLNDQVYNRCIGTRFCQSNCPYKVRRFNFFDYAGDPIQEAEQTPTEPSLLQALKNPDVTVRGRGVMEKCTYCVQRISAARRDAKVDGRALADGEIKTACQAVCPTQAITFGDKNDPGSAVSQLREEPHEYALFGHLGTRPRTTYLKRVVNAAPDLASDGHDGSEESG